MTVSVIMEQIPKRAPQNAGERFLLQGHRSDLTSSRHVQSSSQRIRRLGFSQRPLPLTPRASVLTSPMPPPCSSSSLSSSVTK
ncbi:hypothetical protein EYF80_044311 [Liparis tanakae]|uniref:Uncharacterized protein n=1 Tax=Liparis tanakae TaxID=230148 RepID=A0A4Z2FY78_9TELE|nr:hypothetical protein EYF80_044311 [Liparis tanakae]